MKNESKTPEYKLRANRKYQSKMVQKKLFLNPIKDFELLQAIDKDTTPFSVLVRNLLNHHYFNNPKDDD